MMETICKYLQCTLDTINEQEEILNSLLSKYSKQYIEKEEIYGDCLSILDQIIDMKVDTQLRKQSFVDLSSTAQVRDIYKKNQSKQYHSTMAKEASELTLSLYHCSEHLKAATGTYTHDKHAAQIRFLKQLQSEKEKLAKEIEDIEEAKNREQVDEDYAKEMRKLKSILRMQNTV